MEKTPIYKTSLHWLTLLDPASSILIVILLFQYLGVSKEYYSLVFIGGFFLMLHYLHKLNTTEFLLTESELEIHIGGLNSKSVNLALNQIAYVEVSQAELDKKLNTGRVVISAGASKYKFKYVTNALELREKIMEQIKEIQSKKKE